MVEPRHARRVARGAVFLLLGLGLAACGSPGGGDAAPPAEPATADADVELDPVKQRKIWDLEHVTFLIETYVGAPLAAAVRDRDAEGLRAAMRAGFVANWPDDAEIERRQLEGGGVREVRRAADRTPVTLEAAEAARALLRPLERAERIDAVRWRVLAIDGGGHDGPGRYRTRLLLAARGLGADGGPVEHEAELDAEFAVESLDDFREGRPTLVALTWRRSTDRSAARPLMREVTDEVGLGEAGLPDNWELPLAEVRNHRFQIAVDDYDRDGWPDIVVAAISGGPWLLRNVEGRRFVPVGEALGLRPEPDAERELSVHALAAWIDADNDGFPDLLLGRRLYRNVEGRRFEEVERAGGIRFEMVPFGATVADFDGDGLLDLYLVNQKGFRRRDGGTPAWVGDPEGGTENHLWRNDGGFRFTNVTAATNAGGGRHQTFAAALLHLDDDPYPDLYLANDFGRNVLLRNRGGRFEDVTDGTGTGDFATSMGVAAGDLDNDGSPEIYVANMYSKMGRRIIAHVDDDDYPPGIYPLIRGSCAGNRLYRAAEGATDFEEISDELGVNAVGWAYAPAMIDLDGDGLLDLYATTGFLSYERGKPDG